MASSPLGLRHPGNPTGADGDGAFRRSYRDRRNLFITLFWHDRPNRRLRPLVTL
jgi:hypothetical protein